LRTRAKRTTGKQGLRYTPRPEAPRSCDTGHLILRVIALGTMHSKWFVVAIVAGLLSTGSVNTLVKKLAYDMTSVGRDGLVESFKKVPPRGPVGRRVREALLGGGWCRASPCAAVACACAAAALLMMLLLSQPWTLTLAMFLGETLCLLYWFLKVRRARSAFGGKPAVAQPLLGPAASDPAAARAMADGASSVACGVCAFSLPGRMRSPPALVAWRRCCWARRPRCDGGRQRSHMALCADMCSADGVRPERHHTVRAAVLIATMID
jgi:hypothetical protein